MHVLVEGLNHHGAPLPVRERVFLTGEGLHRWLARLADQPDFSGSAILSTCNRTEFYLTTAEPERAQVQLRTLTQTLDPDGEWETYRYLLHNETAIEHLFRVPSGMDSAILGESQILGQFKAAHQLARQVGAMDARLDFLMRRAITVAKRVRSQTSIGRNPVGFGHVAVQQAREVFGSLHGKSALVVGAGKMAGSSARLLVSDGIGRVYFSTRTPAKAMQLAAGMPAGIVALTVPFSHLEEVAGEVDLIICSTSSPDYVFSRKMVERLMRARRHRPLFLLDLAVPRDVDPEAGEVEDAYLYNVDDLAKVVERGLRRRMEELPQAEAIVREELESAVMALEQEQAVPTISSLALRAEAIRRRQLQNLPADVDPRVREELDRITKSVTAKLLHGPIMYLREHPGDAAAALMVRELFELDQALESEDAD